MTIRNWRFLRQNGHFICPYHWRFWVVLFVQMFYLNCFCLNVLLNSYWLCLTILSPYILECQFIVWSYWRRNSLLYCQTFRFTYHRAKVEWLVFLLLAELGWSFLVFDLFLTAIYKASTWACNTHLFFILIFIINCMKLPYYNCINYCVINQLG